MTESLFAAILIAAVHLLVSFSRRWSEEQAAHYMAFAGGGVTAFTFLFMIPGLTSAQRTFAAVTADGIAGFLTHHAYLIALIGLCSYYALDVGSRRFSMLIQESVVRREARRPLSLLWFGLLGIEALAFVFYAALLGYLMKDGEDQDRLALALMALATAVHVFSIDYKLRVSLGEYYDRFLRWVLVAATISGGVASELVEFPRWLLYLCKSFFVGVLIFSALREKVPPSKDVRFPYFLLGAVLFSVLILIAEQQS